MDKNIIFKILENDENKKEIKSIFNTMIDICFLDLYPYLYFFTFLFFLLVISNISILIFIYKNHKHYK